MPPDQIQGMENLEIGIVPLRLTFRELLLYQCNEAVTWSKVEGETDLAAVPTLQTKVGQGGRELAPNCPSHLRVREKAQFHVSMIVPNVGGC